jgi:two-component system, chemotaxis family, chemotaxis protein CheY
MAKILVVDDSALSRKISKRILVEAGHEVDVAGDGLAALEHYALQRPDLVLLDVTMTEMNGLEVLRQLRALDAQARVVMATADVQASTRKMAADLGAMGFIAKPFVPRPLLDAVAAALATPGDHA